MITVFYADKVIYRTNFQLAYEAWRRTYCTEEIYNGAFMHRSSGTKNNWWRLDGTPVLIEDVPKKLRLAMLVLS